MRQRQTQRWRQDRQDPQRARSPRARRALGLAAVLAASVAWLPSRAAAADPVNLDNPHPRWISMRIASAPQPVLAWLEPGRLPGQVVLTVPAATVEAQLLGAEHPVARSFSDFVWVLDATTGDVLRADLAGRVIHELTWGLGSFDAEVALNVHLDTLHAAGYTPRRLFGRPMRAYCTAADDCTPVTPLRYQPRSGEVRAVGSACARWKGLRTQAFSPLGEASLSEAPGLLRAAAPPPAAPSSLAAGPAEPPGPADPAPANDTCG